MTIAEERREASLKRALRRSGSASQNLRVPLAMRLIEDEATSGAAPRFCGASTTLAGGSRGCQLTPPGPAEGEMSTGASRTKLRTSAAPERTKNEETKKRRGEAYRSIWVPTSIT